MERQETQKKFESQGRLLARLVRVLLARETFESLTDLTEALKVECARLKIRWTNDDITAAYRLIESNRPLPGTPARRPNNPRHIEAVDDARPLSRGEAADLMVRLYAARAREEGRQRA
jgi:head-tail adaptor